MVHWTVTIREFLKNSIQWFIFLQKLSTIIHDLEMMWLVLWCPCLLWRYGGHRWGTRDGIGERDIVTDWVRHIGDIRNVFIVMVEDQPVPYFMTTERQVEEQMCTHHGTLVLLIKCHCWISSDTYWTLCRWFIDAYCVMDISMDGHWQVSLITELSRDLATK